MRCDIICAQELHLKSFDDIVDVKDRWNVGPWMISIGTDTANGIAIFLSETFKPLTSRELILGRLLCLDCLYKSRKIRIINVYAPTERVRKIRPFHDLKDLLGVGYLIIMCADFNTITEISDRSLGPGKIMRDGSLLKNICDMCEMRDSFRVLHPLEAGYTRFDSNTRTRLDRVYISKSI